MSKTVPRNRKVGVFLSHNDAKIPSRMYEGDVGYDLYAIEDYTVPPGTVVEIKTGVHLAIPKGMFVQVNTRSGHGIQGLYVHHGVIDQGYTGEITIFFFNVCATVDTNGIMIKEPVEIKKGDKVAQLLFHKAEYPVLEQVEELPQTERGDKGFGSSGR